MTEKYDTLMIGPPFRIVHTASRKSCPPRLIQSLPSGLRIKIESHMTGIICGLRLDGYADGTSVGGRIHLGDEVNPRGSPDQGYGFW